MQSVSVCVAMMVVGAALADYGYQAPYRPVYPGGVYRAPYNPYRGGRYYYGGKYGGKCAADGLYYKDEASFVICSNGNSYVQPCAPGTRNSGSYNYAPGYYYGYSDFCDVNLVDLGYGAQPYKPGYGYGSAPVKSARYPADNKEYGYEEKSYSKAESYDGKPARKAGYGYQEPAAGYEKKEVVQVKESYGAKPTYDSYDKPVVPKADYAAKPGYGSYSGEKADYKVETTYAKGKQVY